jgi:hypothetical protein
MGHLQIFIKIDYFHDYWSFKVSAIKTRQWPYYIHVYYKYIYGFFNINNDFYYLKQIK